MHCNCRLPRSLHLFSYPSRVVRITLVFGIMWGAIGLADDPAQRARGEDPAAHRAERAQQWGAAQAAVPQRPDELYVCEAEEFQPQQEGWQAAKWGENYYAATFANSFLSRKAFLGAPPQTAAAAVATRDVQIEDAGKYLVLVRYEAAYRFETQFQVEIEQGGRTVFKRLYGARDNVKIWAFSQKLQKEVAWSWGAVENVVWEGHDAYANLQPGRATIRLIADAQPEPAARRNVDLVMLTTDAEQVKMRIEKEGYLPLDGMLTQSGDVFLRVRNRSQQPLLFQGKAATGGGNWQQHSPYWVHLRNWSAPQVEVAPGKTSDWVEVGGTMDSLNDGQWFWTGDQPYEATFALRGPAGKLETLATFVGEGELTLAADADTRYSKRLRSQDSVLYDLLDYLEAEDPAPHGRAPSQTPIYGTTFPPLEDPRHQAAVERFKQLFALRGASAAEGGYIDVRSVATDKLAEYCQQLGPQAKNIAVVSLGDEIGLPSPPQATADQLFQSWLKNQELRPSAVDPQAADWSQVHYSIADATKTGQPGLYYWSKRFQYDFGIQEIKTRTDILRRHLPNAGVGANFSPHYPTDHMFLGETFKWVSVFRADGMTMPWSEDYIWQVPVGTPQMNHINLDLFRAGLRGKPDRKIMYYVMPHAPNNTPRQWRRLFYGAVGHGMKIVNLFEFRPVHVAYTENHVDNPEMYRMVLQSFRELGLFEDVVQQGQVRPAEAGLWFSETGDIWQDSRGSFAPAKRALYTAIRQQQIPLDIVVEPDSLDGTLSKYKVLYLTDAHVSTAASQQIAQWVQRGGKLFVTAGGGMFNERNQPNTVLRELIGIEPLDLVQPENAAVTYIKQDLPFTPPIDHIQWMADAEDAEESGTQESETRETPVISVRARSKLTGEGGRVLGSFSDNSPAIVERPVGEGQVIYCGFLPGLSYYAPAIPRRPVDRGATDEAMIHFLPTQFDRQVGRLVRRPASDLQLPVTASEPLVESTVIESSRGVVIPLVNWTGKPIRGFQLETELNVPTQRMSLASGRELTPEQVDGKLRWTFDLDVADALILRP